MSAKKRFAIVGTGGRSRMFIDALTNPEQFREFGELVALCDLSQVRMDWYNQNAIPKNGHAALPTYHAADFDRMVKETKPDCVIVTTMDSTHHQYIIRALELGCDAITEKPMTTDEVKAQAIFDAVKKSGKKVTVTFNYRYAPISTKVREIILSGAIGDVLHVDFSWVLNTSHGADYFRRWHAEKDKSGGLLVHKSTHHFDLINFWEGSIPKTVYCMGDLKFYGRKNAEARGEKYDYDRYTGSEAAKNDPFALTLDRDPDSNLIGLYRNAEAETGYIRDKNVFGDHITIEDTMSLICRYRSNVLLNYSLIAYCPWEGWRAAVNGNKGRIEVLERHGSHIIAGQSDDELAEEQKTKAVEADAVEKYPYIRVYPMWGSPYLVTIPEAKGGHGGADPQMLRQIFDPTAEKDPFNRGASHIDGAASILMGVAGNKSIATGMPVQIDDLLKLP